MEGNNRIAKPSTPCIRCTWHYSSLHWKMDALDWLESAVVYVVLSVYIVELILCIHDEMQSTEKQNTMHLWSKTCREMQNSEMQCVWPQMELSIEWFTWTAQTVQWSALYKCTLYKGKWAGGKKRGGEESTRGFLHHLCIFASFGARKKMKPPIWNLGPGCCFCIMTVSWKHTLCLLFVCLLSHT